jgi:hypothetical protein
VIVEETSETIGSIGGHVTEERALALLDHVSDAVAALDRELRYIFTSKNTIPFLISGLKNGCIHKAMALWCAHAISRKESEPRWRCERAQNGSGVISN